ncbi:MAG: anti-sigma factor, partial [Pyrinomonadaceae bacterium]
MAHEDYKEMLAAHALSALDDGDARALEEHLAVCSECRFELDQWAETTASLAFSGEVRPLEPSSKVRKQILETVKPDGAGKAAEERRGFSNIAEFNRSSGQFWTPAQVWIGIAAGLVFVVLSISLFLLWQQNRAAREELTRLSQQVRETQEQLAQQQKLIEIVSTPGTRMAELDGTDVMPGASAMLAVDKHGRAILMAKGLPRPPEGKAYQLWFIMGDRPMPGKVFVTDASGDGMLDSQVPAEALNAAVFAVTLEPAPGVEKPTGKMYLK